MAQASGEPAWEPLVSFSHGDPEYEIRHRCRFLRGD